MTGKKKIVSPYYVVTVIILAFLAVFFLFPLYWIVTGSVKEKSDIIIKSGEMVKWIPTTVSWDNFARLFKSKTELFGIGMPMAIRWLFNSVFISATAMILTCITASLAGYVLAKKRFWGKRLIFSLFVCAMALPKQVILIPLMKEMSDLGLIHSVWGSMFAVICPVVGWPWLLFLSLLCSFASRSISPKGLLWGRSRDRCSLIDTERRAYIKDNFELYFHLSDIW